VIDLNSRQRILAAFYLEEPDTVPVSTYMSPYWLQNNWVDEQTFWQFVEKSDAIFRVSVAIRPRKKQSRVKIPEKVWNKKGHQIRLYRIETSDNVLQSISETVGYSRRIVEGLLKTEKDIETWLSIPHERVEFDPEPFFKWDRKLGNNGIAIHGLNDPVGTVISLFTIKDFYKFCITKPELIEKLLDAALEREIVFLSDLLEKGVNRFWISGSEYVTPTFLNPKYFSRFVTKYDRKIVNLIHEYDGIAYMHCHGRINDILLEFPKIGIDVLDPLDPPPQGDMDLSKAKRLIGHKICLVGNIDSNNVMVQGTPETVSNAVRRCIDAAAYGGGYILQPTSGSIFDTPLENIVTLIKAGRKYGNYGKSTRCA